MEKPITSRQARTRASITSVLKAMSDEKALVLFSNVVVPNNNGIISLKKINLTSKQYYSRLSGFLKAGLVIRHKGKYIPTLLGRVVYDSQMVIEEALSNYWRLKVIDQIEMSNSDLPIGEVTRLIDAMIDNYRIKDVLMKKSEMEVRKQFH
jgi:hypothetical protein